MHVFIITQYFPPEIGASASRWGDYVNILIKQNHEVTVLCESPHYPHTKFYDGHANHWSNIEIKNTNLKVIRSKAYASNRKTFIKKIRHYLTFMFSAIVNSRKVKNYDLLIISSPPLFTGVIGLYIKFFQKKEYFLDIRDLWPDSALDLGQIKKGLIYRLGKKLELKIYKAAKGFIFTVPGFVSYFKNFPSEITRKPNFNLINGVSNDFLNESLKLKLKPDKRFTVLYSGNIGLAQDLKTVIKSAEALKDMTFILSLSEKVFVKQKSSFLQSPL